MAVTVYRQGSYEVHFDDNTSVVVTIGATDSFIAHVGHKYIRIADNTMNFNKTIVRVE
jgi:hypothetical protein